MTEGKGTVYRRRRKATLVNAIKLTNFYLNDLLPSWPISVHAMIVSPSGASTDAGSSGMGETTGPDK